MPRVKRLLLQISEIPVLQLAWQKVASNKGAPGVDGITVEMFRQKVDEHLVTLSSEIASGRYRCYPLLSFRVKKANSHKLRCLRIPTVRDRVAQTAVSVVLTDILDREFEDSSFAYRGGRSVASAVQRVIEYRQSGFVHVLDADIQDFFDNIRHDILERRLVDTLPDATLLPLIRHWVSTPFKERGGLFTPQLGIAQGMPLSPMLANLYLDEFDETIQVLADVRLVRYADDFLILARSEKALDEARRVAEDWLCRNGLRLGFRKTVVTSFDAGFQFLGVRFKGATQEACDPKATPWLLPADHRSVSSTGSDNHSADGEGQLHMPEDASSEPIIQLLVTIDPQGVAVPTRTRALSERPAVQVFDDEEMFGYGDAETEQADDSSVDFQTDNNALRTLYINEPGAYVHKRGGRLLLDIERKTVRDLPICKVDQVVMSSEGAVSVGLLRALADNGASFYIQGLGPRQPVISLAGMPHSHFGLRHLQHLLFEDQARRLSVAREIVRGKLLAQRLILRRYFRNRPELANESEASLTATLNQLNDAVSLNQLRGLEGRGARSYFDAMRVLLSANNWNFPGRSKRNAADVVNALMSYGYAILYQNMLTLLVRSGLDPYVGFFHEPKAGHAALASDLMEEFRPGVVDSTVLRILTSGAITADDFAPTVGRVELSVAVRRRLITAIEQKLGAPPDGETIGRQKDYRRLMHKQVQCWMSFLRGEVSCYVPHKLR